MVKITAALALFCAVAAPAFAGPCVALDYQEMKDMSANDLAKEACKARSINEDNSKQTLANLDATRVSKPFPNASENQSQCSGQIDRMMRILSSKGVTEKLYALCEQQARGLTITAPAEAK